MFVPPPYGILKVRFAAPLVSICTGAMILAAAGVLEGRAASTTARAR